MDQYNFFNLCNLIPNCVLLGDKFNPFLGVPQILSLLMEHINGKHTYFNLRSFHVLPNRTILSL